MNILDICAINLAWWDNRSQATIECERLQLFALL